MSHNFNSTLYSNEDEDINKIEMRFKELLSELKLIMADVCAMIRMKESIEKFERKKARSTTIN